MYLRFLCSLACLYLLAASNLSAAETEAAKDPIVVGVVHSEAFPSAESMKRSFDMAVEAVNKAGGVKGRALTLVYADDGLKGGGSIGYQHGHEETAIRSLMDQGAVMLMGGYSSANTIHTAFFAEKLDIPFLVTTAADNQITQRKFLNVFRLNPPAQEYAAAVEDMLKNQVVPKSMAIVYESSRYGTDAAARMLSFCRDNDIKVSKLIPYQKDRITAEYLEKRLRRFEQNPPDILYMVSYLDDAVLLVNTLRQLNIEARLIGAGGGFADPRFIRRLDGSAEGVLTAALWSRRLPYKGAQEYHDMYAELYSEVPDYHGAEAYSAVLVAADAIERANGLSPEEIRKALGDTDIETPFGQVHFESYEKFERQNRTPTVVFKVADSEFEIVWPQKNVADASRATPTEVQE